MIRFAASIAASLAIAAGPGQATPKNPGYARDTAPEKRNGDWYLLCDEGNACAIRGVVKKLRRPAQSRALVLLDRAASADALWHVRIVFLDDAGRDESKEALPANLRLFAVNGSHSRVPVPLDLEGGAGNPIRYLPRSSASPFLAMLANNRKTEIREQGLSFATMPRGNLRKLLDRAEREQRTHVPEANPDELEENGGPPRFEFDIYAGGDERAAAKPEIAQACGRLDARSNKTWELAEGARLWLVECPRETKVFRQFRNGIVEQLHLNGLDGKRYSPRTVDYDPYSGMMSMIVRKKGRADCGYQIRWGWNGSNGFVLIASKKMPLCRNIPTEYWPTLWETERWRVIGSPLDHNSPHNSGEVLPWLGNEQAPEAHLTNTIKGS